MSKIILTLEKLLKLAETHNSSYSFIKEHLDYYIEAYELGFIEKFLRHKKWRENIPWKYIPKNKIKKILFSSIKPHTGLKIYIHNHEGKYLKAKELGLWDEMLVFKGWSKDIPWEDMSEGETFKYIKNVAEPYTSMQTFRDIAPSVYKKCAELGCLNEVTLHMTHGALKLEEMTADDALAYCYRIAKESSTFKNFRQKEAYKHLRNKRGISEMEKACTYFENQTLPIMKTVDIRNEAKEKSPKEVFDVKTISETIAYLISRMDDETYSKFCEKTTNNLLKDIFKITNIELDKANYFWLIGILSNYAQHANYRSAINEYIVKPAIQLGIPLRIRMQLTQEDENQGLFKNMIQNLLPKPCNPYHPETILEMVSRALEEQNDTVPHKNILYKFIDDFGHMSLEELTYDKLKEWKRDISKHQSEKFFPYLRKTLLKTSIEKGLISENFYLEEHPVYKEIDKYIENKNLISKEEWPVFWYYLKVKEEDLKDIKTSNKKGQIMQAFFVLGNIKPSELTKDIYESMLSKKAVIGMMIKDEVYSPNDIIEEEQPYDFEDDRWEYNKCNLNFNLISLKWFRHVVKIYYDKFFLNHTSATDPSNRIYSARFLEEFLLANDVQSMKEFSNETKRRLYLYLDTLVELGRYSRAKSIITFCRSFFLELKKIEPSLVDPNLVFKINEFTLSKPQKNSVTPVFSDLDMKLFLEYINEENKVQTLDERLIDIAVTIQVLLFRRVSETVTLEIDCLRKLGTTGELALSYFSIKKQRNEFVSFTILKGDRKDPFACAIDEFVPRLIKEAINITTEYRKLASKDNKKIFLSASNNIKKYGLIKCFSTKKLATRLNELVSSLGLTIGITSHGARDTAATKLIRSGSTISEVAAALGDEIETTQRSYINTVIEHETMILPRGKLLTNIKDDISDIVLTKYAGEPKVITNEEANSKNFQDVVGGKCSVDINEMLKCPSFLMTSGNRGCKGCSMHSPTPSNLPYWLSQLHASSNRLKEYRGTQFKEHLLYDYQRNENIVNRLKELSNEYS